MRLDLRRFRRFAGLALGLVLSLSCATDGPTAPERASVVAASAASHAGPAVRISEFHYDNTGTDVGEAVEVSAPAGTDLTGWSIVLYNGSGGAVYDTDLLTPLVPTTCGDRMVVVLSYPSNGIQNGSPDGIALVNASGTVIEFLSYEGVFTAVGGAAGGMLSVDVGVSENGTGSASPVTSISRNPNGVWGGPAANTFGACNDGTTNDPPAGVVTTVLVLPPPPVTVVVGGTQQLTALAFDAANQPMAGVTFTWSTSAGAVATVGATGLVTGIAVGSVTMTATAPNGVSGNVAVTVNAAAPVLPAVRFSEIHYDNVGTDVGEAIEVEGPAGTDLAGWRIALYNGNGGVTYGTDSILTGTLPDQCSGRGTRYVNYPSNGIQNGGTAPEPDGMALVNASGAVVEFLSYEGVMTATNGPAAGMTSINIGVSEATSSPIGQSLQRDAAGVWSGPIAATFGVCTGQTPPPPPSTISFTGRLAADPPLPVGFEDQIFATLRSGTGVVVPSTFIWASETPLIASIDANGVMRSLAAGTAVVRATAEDGTTATYPLPTQVGVVSTTAIYAGNAEFGEPADADATDDFIVRRAQYTASYNSMKGTPNWVSYNLEATHFGAEDRCDCFTFDPELPTTYSRYTTADYTGAGTFHGYGIDRGHLARSFDRTTGSYDNATTYYFSNIIPQAADNNQGPWAAMENYLGDLARFSDREVYIIAGPAGSKGTVKNEGKITIPAAVWKVAVVLPRNAGLTSINSWQDVTVISVIMPNDPGVRSVNWETYRTTVDAVEALSGYDLLALLRDDIEIAVESGTVPPDAMTDGPWSAFAGDPVALSGAGSTDGDGDALVHAWDFGDGSTGSGVAVSHTWANTGTYAVRLIVTDTRGLADTATATASITMLPHATGIARARAGVRGLVGDGWINAGQGNSMTVKLDAALRSLERGSDSAAIGQLGAFLNELNALVQSGRITDAQAAPMRDVITRVLQNLGA